MAQTADAPSTIRRAGIDDAAALARLRWLWRTGERGELGLSMLEFQSAFTQWWAAHQSSHVAYVAEHAEEAVGMAWLAIFNRIPHPRSLERPAGNVQSVFVVEEQRNRGTGKALVEAVVEEARRRGLGYLILHPSERASPLYKRLGFAAPERVLYFDLDGSSPG